MNVTLRQLEVLVALAETEHVGAAAELLRLSTSATSAALAALERGLGTELFDRVGRGIRLNADGRRVRDAAADVLDRVAAIETMLATHTTGRLVVGTSTTIASAVIGPAVASFVDDNPGVDVVVEVGNTTDVAGWVTDRRVDVAFVEGAVVDAAVRSTAWRRDRLALVVAPDHPLAALGRVRREDLAGTWVLREEGSGTRESFVNALGDDAALLGRVVEVGSSTAIASVVAAGLGVGCLSELVVGHDVTAGRLVELVPPPTWALERTLWLLTPVRGRPSAVGRAFLDHLGIDRATPAAAGSADDPGRGEDEGE